MPARDSGRWPGIAASTFVAEHLGEEPVDHVADHRLLNGGVLEPDVDLLDSGVEIVAGIILNTGEEASFASLDLADLMPKFLANRQRDLLQIEEAIDRADNAALRIIGHNMKGVGGGYGFIEITEMGKRLEAAAKTGDQALLRKQLNEYKEYLSNLEVRYV
mgnify:CR=1 FL=1